MWYSWGMEESSTATPPAPAVEQSMTAVPVPAEPTEISAPTPAPSEQPVEKPAENSAPKEPEVKRDEHGRLLPGSHLNPNGQGKGNLSIVKLLREKLDEVPEGRKKSYVANLIEVILDKALVERDVKMIIDIINRIDGKPMQPTELKGQLDIKGALVEFLE